MDDEREEMRAQRWVGQFLLDPDRMTAVTYTARQGDRLIGLTDRVGDAWNSRGSRQRGIALRMREEARVLRELAHRIDGQADAVEWAKPDDPKLACLLNADQRKSIAAEGEHLAETLTALKGEIEARVAAGELRIRNGMGEPVTLEWPLGLGESRDSELPAAGE